jgi:molecular chaperone GrpE
MTQAVERDDVSKDEEHPADEAGAMRAAVPSATGPEDALRAQLSEMEARILGAFQEKLAFDATKEKQIDRMHDELQRYRSDLVAKATRPVLNSLVRLHDDMGKVLDALAAERPEKLSAEQLLKLLHGFRDDVELALNNSGVTSFRGVCDVFDPKRQRVMRTIETEDQAQVGRLAERVRVGFEDETGIIEKERVAVYVISRPKTTQGTKEQSP